MMKWSRTSRLSIPGCRVGRDATEVGDPRSGHRDEEVVVDARDVARGGGEREGLVLGLGFRI